MVKFKFTAMIKTASHGYTLMKIKVVNSDHSKALKVVGSENTAQFKSMAF